MLPFQLELVNKLHKIMKNTNGFISALEELPFDITHVVKWEKSFNEKGITINLSRLFDHSEKHTYKIIWNRNYTPVIGNNYGECKIYLLPVTGYAGDLNVYDKICCISGTNPFIEISDHAKYTNGFTADLEISNFIAITVSQYPVIQMEGNNPDIINTVSPIELCTKSVWTQNDNNIRINMIDVNGTKYYTDAPVKELMFLLKNNHQ